MAEVGLSEHKTWHGHPKSDGNVGREVSEGVQQSTGCHEEGENG